MAGDWPEIPLGELCSLITDGKHGDCEDEAHSGFYFLSVKDVFDGRLVYDNARQITERDFLETHRRTNLQPGDVLFTNTGTIGRMAIAREDPKTYRTTFQKSVAILKPKREIINPQFLYYLLHFDNAKLSDFAAGTTQKNLLLKDFRSFSVQVPTLAEQRAIARILGTLDDKIELNRRMNETLEAMARAVFKSWFVDFDPVRAKAEGRNPGLPKPIADLFPDSFEDSELGEIPKGWGVGKLGDVLEQRVERCVASDETAARPYVAIDCISSKSLFLMESKPGEEAQSSLTKFYKGDLLFGAMRPYFHKVCIAPFDGTTRTTAFVLHPRRNDDFAFATLLLHHPETIDYATRHSTGSTIPYAVWNASLEDMPAIVPPYEVRQAFDVVVRPVLAGIPEPYFQNRTLAAVRGALLPKLLSGEIRVTDAEKIVEAL